MTTKTMNNLSCFAANAPMESMAAIAALEDAHTSQKQAATERRTARTDRLHLMKQAAQKLREMANKTAASALYQGVLSGMQAIASTGADFSAGVDKKIFNAYARGYGVMKVVDGFAMSKAQDEVVKKELEIEAERASSAAENANDDLAHARRLIGSATSLLKSLTEARQAAEMAAIRG